MRTGTRYSLPAGAGDVALRLAIGALNDLAPVSKGVAELKSLEPFDRHRVERLAPVPRQGRPPRAPAGDLGGEVGLGGRAIEALFSTDMNLAVPHLEPDSPSALERRRLGDL